jgi:hypothetical protein
MQASLLSMLHWRAASALAAALALASSNVSSFSSSGSLSPSFFSSPSALPSTWTPFSPGLVSYPLLAATIVAIGGGAAATAGAAAGEEERPASDDDGGRAKEAVLVMAARAERRPPLGAEEVAGAMGGEGLAETRLERPLGAGEVGAEGGAGVGAAATALVPEARAVASLASLIASAERVN